MNIKELLRKVNILLPIIFTSMCNFIARNIDINTNSTSSFGLSKFEAVDQKTWPSWGEADERGGVVYVDLTIGPERLANGLIGPHRYPKKP